MQEGRGTGLGPHGCQVLCRESPPALLADAHTLAHSPASHGGGLEQQGSQAVRLLTARLRRKRKDKVRLSTAPPDDGEGAMGVAGCSPLPVEMRVGCHQAPA